MFYDNGTYFNLAIPEILDLELCELLILFQLIIKFIINDKLYI
jgi:hypothetical protein